MERGRAQNIDIILVAVGVDPSTQDLVSNPDTCIQDLDNVLLFEDYVFDRENIPRLFAGIPLFFDHCFEKAALRGRLCIFSYN